VNIVVVLANHAYRVQLLTLDDFELGKLDRGNFLGE
jgi:hypothetical protein